MCGISGIISISGRPVPIEAAQRMHAALAHRGPDGEGAAFFPLGQREPRAVYRELARAGRDAPPCWAALFHRRLAIIDLSRAGLQPMAAHSGRWWVACNGEIYNYLELRQSLPAPPGGFRSQSDTEVLLEAWSAEQERCLRRLNGMWAFAALDARERTLWLCRDRFGVKPLYYATAGDCLLFASEIKALLASGLIPRRFAREAVEDYVAYGVYVAQGHDTFYEGVHKLPAAGLLRCQGGRLRTFRHYTLEPRPPRPLPKLIETARDLFADAVRLRLRSDAPLATCLSGGVDSTNVVAFAARELRRRAAPSRLCAYTIDVGDRDENEMRAAEQVARLNGCEWRTEPLVRRLSAADVLDFVRMNEEPQEFLGSIVQYLLYRRIAADGIKVVLDGQGGDEALAGYAWFYYPIARDALQQLRLLPLLLWLRGLRQHANTGLRRLWRLAAHERHPRRAVRSAALPLLRRNIRRPGQNPTLAIAARCTTWPQRQQAAYFNLELPSLLRDADRNSMRWGIEARLPFMDYRLVELAHSADPLDLTHDGWSKYVSRSFATDDMIPSAVRWSRWKKGFYIDLAHLFPQIQALLREWAPAAELSADIIDWNAACAHLARPGVPVWPLFNVLALDLWATSAIRRDAPDSVVDILRGAEAR